MLVDAGDRSAMTRPLAALTLVLALLLGGVWAAQAQTTVATPPADGGSVDVPLGQFVFSVDGDQALTACVTERRESMTGIFVTLQLFTRLESGDVVPSVAYATRATGVLAEAHVEQCFLLAPEPVGAGG
jgi:hypothetical protein